MTLQRTVLEEKRDRKRKEASKWPIPFPFVPFLEAKRGPFSHRPQVLTANEFPFVPFLEEKRDVTSHPVGAGSQAPVGV